MAYGEGSFSTYTTQGGVRWRVVVGYINSEGVYRQRKSSGHKSKTDARKAARKILQVRDSGMLIDNSKVTFDDFVDTDYLPYVKKKGRTPLTLRSYENSLKLWVSPTFGSMAIQKITTDDVQRMLDSLGDKGLARSTIRLCLVLTSAALQLAVDKEIVIKNVARNGLLLIPVNSPKSTKEPWNADEAKVFLTGLRPDWDDMELCFLVMALTGIRRGEAAALRWGDLDLETGLIHVQRSVQSVDGVLHISDGGKTDNARRIVGLVGSVMKLLVRHRRREVQKYLANGLVLNDDSAVFASWLCAPRSPQTFTLRFTQTVRRLGVRPVPLHSLRHLMVTQAQMNPVVSQIMLQKVVGHSNSAMSGVYTHADAEVAHLVADVVAERLLN